MLALIFRCTSSMSVSPSLNAAAPVTPLYPFRPLFLCAAAFASLGMLAWSAFLHAGWIPSAALLPIPWHGHAMLYGFAGALIGGFVLTAAANWTGLRTTTPPTLGALVALWLLARIAPLSPLPWWLGAVFDIAYLLVLSVLTGRVILKTHNRRNLFVVGILLIYAAIDAWFFAGVSRNDISWMTHSLLVCVDLLTLLMAAIGGRVIPFFTTRRMPELKIVSNKTLTFAVNGGALLALLCDLLAISDPVRGAISIALALLVLMRLAGWRGWRTLREPMLWVLHLGYLWLAAGLALRGLGLLGAWTQPEIETLHGITVGALGTLSIGMMSRVALGHSGRAIHASRWLIAAFMLPSVAAIVRLACGPAGWIWAACLWVLAFAIYLGVLGPLLLRGRLSATPRA